RLRAQGAPEAVRRAPIGRERSEVEPVPPWRRDLTLRRGVEPEVDFEAQSVMPRRPGACRTRVACVRVRPRSVEPRRRPSTPAPRWSAYARLREALELRRFAGDRARAGCWFRRCR